jgi:hypothetical protein
MNVYISIDGVLRNFVSRFHYHYEQAYIDVENPDESFEYKVIEPIANDNLMGSFAFQSKEEYEFFRYIEYPMELYGHSPISYNGAINDLNKYVHENPTHNVTLVGLDEFGKSRPATFFFLSRNGCMVNNVKFITSDNISKEWENVDIWISDNKQIMESCPEGKEFQLFETKYNQHFTYDKKINKLIESQTPITFDENKLIENN